MVSSLISATRFTQRMPLKVIRAKFQVAGAFLNKNVAKKFIFQETFKFVLISVEIWV